MNLKKYIAIAKLQGENRLQYRSWFAVGRVTKLVFFFASYYLWTAVFSEHTARAGFDRDSIVSYILLTNLLAPLIISYQSDTIADAIALGNISSTLTKPVSYLGSETSRRLSRRFFNLIEAAVETAVLTLLLKPNPLLNHSWTTVAAGVSSVFLGAARLSLLDYSTALLTFWPQRAYGPRFILRRVMEFASGRLLPLSILPTSAAGLFQALPFSYTLFFPLQIWLGKLSYQEVMQGLLKQLFWLALASAAVRLLWKKGLKNYEAVGG